MITYKQSHPAADIIVLLNKKIAGSIKKQPNGYQYFPKGKKTGGQVFPTVLAVQISLENE
jgi:hypothetical protein